VNLSRALDIPASPDWKALATALQGSPIETARQNRAPKAWTVKPRKFFILVRHAIARVTEGAVVKAQIPREERRPAQSKQEWNQFLVLHALVAEFVADLSNWDAPASQQLPLALQDVLVENVHAAAGLNASSCACSRKVSPAVRTASAMAPALRLPRHSSMMLSQAMPLATCSSTSATRIRVPRKVGCPWQTFGSMMM